jgi:hypothetical protein
MDIAKPSLPYWPIQPCGGRLKLGGSVATFKRRHRRGIDAGVASD